uniref:hypothetical protein n=1 Tax=Bordetella sputigena TaxID=1416810 RepID=UPI0039EE95D8
MHQVLTENIWSAAAKVKRGATIVVSAYVTDDPLHLSVGDTLYCDASDQIVKSGTTKVETLVMLHKRGVSIVSVPRLHAKVVRTGGHAVIGSSNMTKNSEQLTEVTLLTSDGSIVAQVDEIVVALAQCPSALPLDEDELARPSAIEVNRDTDMLDVGARLWITDWLPVDETESLAIAQELGDLFNDGEKVQRRLRCL